MIWILGSLLLVGGATIAYVLHSDSLGGDDDDQDFGC